MTCRFCKGRIGAVRWLKDNDYCCDDHRKAGRASARASREKRDILDFYDEYSTVEQPAAPASKQAAGPPSSPKKESSSNAFLMLLFIGIGVGIFSLLSTDRSGGETVTPTARSPRTGTFKDFIRAHATVRLQADFGSGLTGWSPPKNAISGGSRWQQQSGFLKPGSLRVWEPSMDLTDYRLEFAGSIENKAMSWTYRTVDARNFYAGRLVITRGGPLPEVQLIRYARVNGQEVKRLSTRLPMTVRSDSVYKVDVKLNGADISTAINGVMVDAWTDERFASGGVGFYAENDEVALLRYVEVTQKDNFFGRILAHFGLIHPTFFRASF